jgi:hypothetical protein
MCKRRWSLIYCCARSMPRLWRPYEFVRWYMLMFSHHLLKVRRKYSSWCDSALER